MAKQNGVRTQPTARLSDFPITPKVSHGAFSWAADEVDQFALNDPSVVGEHSGHVHWSIQAYMDRAPNGNLLEVVAVTVEAVDAYAAVHRARTIFPLARYYRVAAVNEACTLADGIRKD